MRGKKIGGFPYRIRVEFSRFAQWALPRRDAGPPGQQRFLAPAGNSAERTPKPLHT